MSMTINIGEDQIAEAISGGSLHLATIIEALRFECADDLALADHLAEDFAGFLDSTHLSATSTTRRLIEAFERAVTEIIETLEEDADE